MDKIFPFKYIVLPGLGKVFSPQVRIGLYTINGVVDYDFLVDTGSDLTTLPYYMATILDIDLKKCKTSTAEGLGGHIVKTWLVKVKLIIQDEIIEVRASITNENSTPFLLGRADLLDKMFGWSFDANKKQIIFSRI